MRYHMFRTIDAISPFLALILLGLSGGAPALAASPNDFRAETTREMVALCGADPASETYVAAIHFCHGFAIGAYQYHASLAAASPADRFVCLSDPAPSRSAAIADFLRWMDQHAEYLPEPPVDSMFRYLASRYPCPQ